MKKVVTIGGGTGTFTVLTGLKKYPLELTAIVTMADDGGSTGRLRDEFGVLPPGDVRRCLVALSDGSRAEILRELFDVVRHCEILRVFRVAHEVADEYLFRAAFFALFALHPFSYNSPFYLRPIICAFLCPLYGPTFNSTTGWMVTSVATCAA